MDIIKASGEKEKFDRDKLYQSLRSSGVSSKLAADICQKVAGDITPDAMTDDISKKVSFLLGKQNSSLAARYNLKNAIMELGPAGFVFEQFIAQILDEYGYQTKTGQEIRGSCAVHEVDVVAEKDKENFMLECKYHNHRGIKCDLKVALYTYARFLDVKQAYPFEEGWLVTNTKCTSQAVGFAKCKGLKVISWHYPQKESLNALIDKKGLYPITILPSLSGFARKQLSQNNVILAKDLLKYTQNDLIRSFGFQSNVAKKLLEEINNLYY